LKQTNKNKEKSTQINKKKMKKYSKQKTIENNNKKKQQKKQPVLYKSPLDKSDKRRRNHIPL
jgi:hypothetical protein